MKYMQQLEEENLRLKKLVADLSLDKAMPQDVLARKNCASARMGPGPAGTARGRSVLHYRSAAALSATVLWRQTTEHYAFVSGRSPQPGSTIAIAGLTSCSGGRAGGIITNAFIDSTASKKSF